jgi:HAD superfamily hydrolase (TIGR01450 family)
VTSLVSQYDAILADLDGVVYEGTAAIAHAAEAIAKLQTSHRVGFVTNNSSRKPETIVAQLAGFGVTAKPEDVVSSGQSGVELLQTLVAPGSKVLVVGGEGLRFYTEAAGFALVDSADDAPAAVIQGFAPDVSWRHLAEASFAIQRGAKWVATNQDWTLPQERGMAPGNGTLVSAVHTAVGQLPLVAGKPEPAIFGTAVQRFQAKRPLFIGDRIDTDIVGANRAKMPSVLVLTGVSRAKEVLAAKEGERPTYILQNLSQLFEPYKEPKQTKRGYSLGKAEVELLGKKVVVVSGDPKSVEVLRCACATIWNSGHSIYALDVDSELYE